MRSKGIIIAGLLAVAGGLSAGVPDEVYIKPG